MSTRSAFLLPGLVLTAIFALIVCMGEVTGAALHLAGRTSDCSFEGAVAAMRMARLKDQYRNEIASHSRLIETKDGLERWSTPHGEFWVPAGTISYLHGELGEQQAGIYSEHGLGARSGDVVLDCGASLGAYTRKALSEGASKVIAIEPVPANVVCLQRTFSREIAEGKVVVAAKGVWDQEGSMEMYIDSQSPAVHSFVRDFHKENKRVRLPLTTIDRLAGELHLETVNLIKMDIEGAERNALRGAKATLARFHPRLAMCVYHLPDDPKLIPAIATAAWPGYQVRCGACMRREVGYLTPEVYFFF